LRLIMAELQIADVRAQVALSLMADFTNFTEFTPQDHHVESLTPLFDQVVSWSTALAGTRS
ncbi:MAG: hypothetical protein QOD02_45, partial [Mycobacterium sp.]|nr:hypothetical protein [Mycobacterium sp.]